MNTRRFLILFASFAQAIVLSGCSVDMFTAGSADPKSGGGERYRKIRPECSGLKIDRPELDPKTFRSLVKCFGANGSISEIEKLVAGASDSTVRQTVDLLNATFLANPQVRADSRAIVRKLDRGGEWGPILSGFGSAFRDPERMRALARLLSLGGRDPLIVETVSRFEASNTLAGFELLARLTKSPAFAELSRKVHADPLRNDESDRLLDLLVDFFKRPTPKRSAKSLVEDMAAGRSSALWSYAFGEGSGILDSNSRFALLLHDFSGPEGLRRLSQFHRGFHNPISCWSGGKVFAEPWKNLTDELRTHASAGPDAFLGFVTRFASVTALGIKDLCPLPEEFTAYYPAVLKLTMGRTGGEYLGLLERVFSGGFGVSAGYFVGEWGDSLAEVLTVFESKSWFGDLVLLFAELDENDRELFAGWTRGLLKNQTDWIEHARRWTRSDLDPVFSDLGVLLGSEPRELNAVFGSIQALFESSRVHPWFEGWKKVAVESESNGIGTLTDLPSFPEASRAIGEMAEDGRLAAILGDVLEILAGGRDDASPGAQESEIAIRKALRHRFVGSDLLPLETRVRKDGSIEACARLDLRLPVDRQWETYRACLAGGGVDSDAWAGLKIARDWKVDEGGRSVSFFDFFVSSWLKLPLTTSDKRILISTMSEIPSKTIRTFLADFRLKFSNPTDGPSRIFQILSEFQTQLSIGQSTWDRFFARVREGMDDPRFVPIARALRSLKDSADENSGTRIGPASRPLSAELTQWIRDFECETGDPRPRIAEIEREFDEAVLGWERPEGHLPYAWSLDQLKPRMEAFRELLATRDLRANLYDWVGGLDPEFAAKWFHDRAADPRLVTVLDPDTRRVRVRWMTSLDRLESILVNANFTYLLNGNYGLKFIGKFAEAWGDEPRSKWPAEIQARYTGSKTPPRLVDVYEEVESFVRWFEKFGGVPTVSDCRAKGSTPDAIIPFSVKAKAFNLKQTLSVIRENLPGSGEPSAGGMRFLRDLFWAVHASAPAADRDPSRPERNPLRFFLQLGDLGGLRSISRGLQSVEWTSERKTLEDSFSSLRSMVREPAFERILARVFADPSGVDALVTGAFQSSPFRFGTLSTRVLSGLATERSLRVSPPLLCFFDRSLGSDLSFFPFALFTDLVVSGGEGESERLHSLRSSLSMGDYFENRIVPALEALPVGPAIRTLEKNPALRGDLRAETRRWLGSSRQTNDDRTSFSLFLDELLSTERPQTRRLLSFWCGQNGGRFTSTLASRPNDAFLLLDGVLLSAQSGAFEDFLDSLLRQLPN